MSARAKKVGRPKRAGPGLGSLDKRLGAVMSGDSMTANHVEHSPCLSLWGTSALHDVPDPGDKGAAQSARTVEIGGESIGPCRSDARHTAGLSDLSDRGHLGHAPPGCRC